MNSIEYNKIERETFNDIYFGEVVSISDTENVNRIKVRVRGVFDEPVKKEDIPWALPTFACEVPDLGTEVAIWFHSGDMERPFYFPKGYLSKSQNTVAQTVYSTLVDNKKNNVKSEIGEPATTDDGAITAKKHVHVYPEDVATEQGEGVNVGNPSTGTVVSVNKEKGKEEVSIMHPSGTFVDIRPDGTVVVHSVGDGYVVADGKIGVSVGGDLIIKVSGGVSVSAQTFTVNSPSVKVTGGEIEIDGVVTPSSTGVFCGITKCLLTGANHVGKKATNT